MSGIISICQMRFFCVRLGLDGEGGAVQPKDMTMKHFLILALSMLVSPCFAQTPPPAAASTGISVTQHGALGNGVADDTKAFQKAIDATPAGGVLTIPTPKLYYKVTGSLLLKSDITIKGIAAKIFMPARKNGDSAPIFYTNRKTPTRNIDISGLGLFSSNSVPGTGYYANSKVSNVTAFHFENASNVRLHDLSIYYTIYGIKLSAVPNAHFFIDKVKIFRSATDIYMSHAQDVHITNSYLDTAGFLNTDRHLHNVYIESAVSDVYFDNVTFAHTAGAGLHIYQESNSPARNISIKNAKFNRCGTAVVAWDAQNITMTKFSVAGVPTVLSIKKVDNIKLSEGIIKLGQHLLESDKDASTNVVLDGLSVNAATASANAILNVVYGDKVTFSRLKVGGLQASTRLFYNGRAAAATGVLVKDSEFNYIQPPAQQVIAFQNYESNAVFENNKFFNRNRSGRSLSYNLSKPGSIVFKNNSLVGFSGFAGEGDTGTVNQTNNAVSL